MLTYEIVDSTLLTSQSLQLQTDLSVLVFLSPPYIQKAANVDMGIMRLSVLFLFGLSASITYNHEKADTYFETCRLVLLSWQKEVLS
jgi:hypothetical protein